MQRQGFELTVQLGVRYARPQLALYDPVGGGAQELIVQGSLVDFDHGQGGGVA
jgi:hypothetical protein